MASSQKKPAAASKKDAPAKNTNAQRSGGSRTRRSEPQPKPIRREVGGVVCLLLAFFGIITFFQVDALFINLFRNLLGGLVGYGAWAYPPMLLVGAYILLFHRGRPVRLRLSCALVFPVMMGSVLHLFLVKESYEWAWAMFGQLWKSGCANTSGGVVSGLLAIALKAAFSKVGALVMLILVAALMLLLAFNQTISGLFHTIRERAENRPRYVPEEKPEKGKPAAEPAPAKPRKQAAIDIPVDDNPTLGKVPTQPVTGVRKKRLFDRMAGTASPDQVLTGEVKPPMEETPPEYEATPDLSPVMDSTFVDIVSPVPTKKEQPAPAAPPQPAEDDPVPPPVIREPGVEKVNHEQAVQARDEVTREIEESMEREIPVYRYPPLSLLTEGKGGSVAADEELRANQRRLQDTLVSFGVDAHITDVTRGPAVTLYELELEQGVKLNKITNLSDDIALALGASAVRVAPIPDKISTVGIEVPNRQVAPVAIRDVIGSPQFSQSKSKVSFAVGKNIGGNCVVGDIAKLTHVLIAGTTGSGKSVCTNSLIVSLLYKSTPEEVRLIMVDPKMVELSVYNGIPHLLIPVVTDPKKAAGALQWAVNEMMKRYRAFSEVGAKDLESYNNHAVRDGKETMPKIVVVIDELADLMLVAAKEVEESICRVAQMGRAAGMHLVIATQRPSADVITGLMKANIPSRIAFAVASSLESRIILDNTGAEKLVGKGDMLYCPLGSGKPQRIQGCFISESEVASVVEFIKESGTARYDEEVMHEIDRHAEEKDRSAKGVGGSDPGGDTGDNYDELLPAAIDVVLEVGQASVSMLQRRLKLGYGRAARLVDQMEEKGVIGPFEGSKPRQLLITKEQWQEMQYRQDMTAAVPEEFPFEGDAIPQTHELPRFDD
ncbi:MAG: DNA translocase FtsK [Oscillospiraceae bacterium]|nr:DNA translocase FtsK [Oscillospiraceae bacterium]